MVHLDVNFAGVAGRNVCFPTLKLVFDLANGVQDDHSMLELGRLVQRIRLDVRRLVERNRNWFCFYEADVPPDEGDVPPDSSIDSLFVSPRVPRVLRVSLISVVLGGSGLAAVALEQRQFGPALSPVTLHVEPEERAEPGPLPPRQSVVEPDQTANQAPDQAPDQTQTPRGLKDERGQRAPTAPQWPPHERAPLVPPWRPTDVVVRAKKQPLQITRPNPKTDNEPISSSTLAKKDVQAMMQSWEGQVLVCYDKLLPTQPHLEGTVEIEVAIVPDGRVSSVAARGLDPEVTRCIEKAFRGAKVNLVKPIDQPINITYAFRLNRSLPIW